MYNSYMYNGIYCKQTYSRRKLSDIRVTFVNGNAIYIFIDYIFMQQHNR